MAGCGRGLDDGWLAHVVLCRWGSRPFFAHSCAGVGLLVVVGAGVARLEKVGFRFSGGEAVRTGEGGRGIFFAEHTRNLARLWDRMHVSFSFPCPVFLSGQSTRWKWLGLTM